MHGSCNPASVSMPKLSTALLGAAAVAAAGTLLWYILRSRRCTEEGGTTPAVKAEESVQAATAEPPAPAAASAPSEPAEERKVTSGSGGTGAVGAGTGSERAKKKGKGAPKVNVTVPLRGYQRAYLAEMAAAHGLPDESKALRCIVNYCRSGGDDGAGVDTHDLFRKIRCLGCGKTNNGAGRRKVKTDVVLQLTKPQQRWLADMAAEFVERDVDKTVRVLIDFAIKDADPADVYGVQRCSSK